MEFGELDAACGHATKRYRDFVVVTEGKLSQKREPEHAHAWPRWQSIGDGQALADLSGDSRRERPVQGGEQGDQDKDRDQQRGHRGPRLSARTCHRENSPDARTAPAAGTQPPANGGSTSITAASLSVTVSVARTPTGIPSIRKDERARTARSRGS